MATFSKERLSASTGGRQIKVAATTSPGTVIHTTGTSASVLDEIWIYAYCSDSADRALTLEWGGTTAPDDVIKLTITKDAGLILVVPGLILSGDGTTGRTLRAYGAATNVIMLSGYVNRIA